MNGVLTRAGKKYMMTLIDDATKWCYLFLVKTKDEALECFKIYKAEVETPLNKKIKRLRSDRGGEYLSKEFSDFCAEHGIIHETTAPYSPQSNGVAERKNRTLTDLVNAMLDSSGLPKPWWGEAVLAACYVLNRVPTSKGEITPYEGWKGRKPTLRFLRAWGCLAKVNVPAVKKRKLGPKTVDCVFLGYAKNSIAYRFLVIKSGVADVNVNTVIESSDATFFENIFPMKRDETPSDNLIPYPIPEPVVPSETPDVENNSEECVPRRSKRQRREKSFGNDFAVFLVDDEPRTLLEAFASPDADYWKETVQSEMDSILAN